MHRYAQVSGAIFALVSVLQLVRVLRALPVQIGDYAVPISVSGIAFVSRGSDGALGVPHVERRCLTRGTSSDSVALDQRGVVSLHQDRSHDRNGHTRELIMQSKRTRTVAIAMALVAFGNSAMSAQDKYTVKVPGGLAFSEFKGYEGWQLISVSQNGGAVAAILGNPDDDRRLQGGIPGNGKPFPDGAKMAKIHWNPKKLETSPGRDGAGHAA